MSKNPDVIQYLLFTLSSYENDDIDSDDFEVAFENEQGIEGFAACSITETAADALCLIETLTKQRDELLAALHDAATSLETIQLRSFGADSFLDDKHSVLAYAGSRASVAREAISKEEGAAK